MSFAVAELASASEKFGKQGRLATDEPTERIELSGAALAGVIEAEFRRLAQSTDAPAAPIVGLLVEDAGAGDDSG
jgi:hypothetical protein